MKSTSDGLERFIAAQTRLSHIDGVQGTLTIAGYDAADLATNSSFERVFFLLLYGRLPGKEEHAELCAELARHRRLPDGVLRALRDAAGARMPFMAALRLGLCALAASEPRPEQIVGALPSILATYVRLLQRPFAVGDTKRRATDEVLPIRLIQEASSTQAEFFLHALQGREPTPLEVRALDAYWTVVSDHGLNASTFTARVIASTHSDLVSAVVGALGALQGPLHGGAPGPALSSLLELRKRGGNLAEQTRRWVREQVDAQKRIMGFGHRVYRVRDPRADVLAGIARQLLRDTELYADARTHERAVLDTLAELKPGRALATNVEFYTALLLHGLGLRTDLFTPVFALGRAAGWIAHALEQQQNGRLIRPCAEYVGPRERRVALVTPNGRRSTQ